MSSFHNNALVGASGQAGYQIERSLRFNSADSAYLNRTPASAGNRRTFTWSGWFKVGNHSSSGEYYLLGTNGTADSTFFYIEIRNNQLRLGSFNSGTFGLFSTQLFRDPSAWYHLVVAVDTTQATAANRAKAYVNGTQITTWSTANYPSQNSDLGANDTRAHAVGAGYASGSPYAYWDGLLTECHLIDGQALTPSSFGETDTITGVWKPKKYAGTYGTNGFYLKFADNSGTTSTTLGKDSSGNSNNWTPNNFSVTAGAGNDSMIDTPTPYADGGNGRGNYCTLNPLWNYASTLSNGNLDWTTSTLYGQSCSSIAVSSGKWYWEINVTSVGMVVGIIDAGKNPASSLTGSRTYYSANGNKYTDATPSAYGASYTNGDVIGCALDLDNGTLVFYKNNTSQGTAFTGLSGTYYIGFIAADNNFSRSASINFGQRAFAYTPPSGFLALNTNSLPEPSIKKPSQWMDATLYTGTGAALSVANAVGFQPDLVWGKSRSAATNNNFYDALRGTGKILVSNNTDAEVDAGSLGLTAFNSNGFSLGSGSTLNNSGSTYVAWQWKESATPGFDIVTYTGNGTNPRTVSHSLGVAPKFIIVKSRDSGTDNWNCWHTSLNNTAARILLNTTGAVDTGSPSIWGTGGINPTSTTFQVGDNTGTNKNTDRYVAYLWSEVAGFSKFGSYTGNGSSDGPFVFCGFRPRWVLVKVSSTTNEWRIYDAARLGYNTVATILTPNSSLAEGTTSNPIDLLSNGFKLRGTDVSINSNGDTYIYAAFAESPFKYSLAR